MYIIYCRLQNVAVLCSEAMQCTWWSYIYWSAQCTNCPTLVHTSNWHRSAGPIQWHWPIHVMTVGHRCTRLIYPDGALICTPASQAPSSRSLPACQACRNLPWLYCRTLDSEFTLMRPLKQGDSQPKSAFTLFLPRFEALDFSFRQDWWIAMPFMF